MNKVNYLQRGEALDYTNNTDELIPEGVVIVIGSRIGVTGCPIPPGQTGSLHVCGVFEFEKTDTAEVEMGQIVYFDGTGITSAAASEAADDSEGGEDADATDTTETTDTADEAEAAVSVVAGYAAAPAAADATTILVAING